MGGLATEQAVEILVPELQVDQRIDQMATECLERYAGEQVLYVCLLYGGVHFTTKLMASMTRQEPSYHPPVEYLRCSAYGDEYEPGETATVDPLGIEAVRKSGLKPVIVDEVLDTGTSIHSVQVALGEDNKPADVDLVVLVQKDKDRKHWPEATLRGFELPEDEWLVGMGMDHKKKGRGAYRWTGYIGALAKA